MEGTKPRTASSIGMFDMLKGAGMLTIVFAHTAELYPMQAVSGLSLTAFFPFIYREALMAAFFIASGYGFRKRSIHKCIHQQLKSLLKPYAYTALFTCVLHFIIHYKTFQYLRHHRRVYQGHRRLSAGPAPHGQVFRAGVLLLRADVVSAGADGRLGAAGCDPEHLPGALCSMGCGRLRPAGLGREPCVGAAFCLIQGAVVVPYLYIGFLAKKKHLLDEPLPPKVFAGLLAATALIAVGALATRTTDCISLAEWSLGPLSIFLDGAAGLLFIRLFMRLSRGHGPIVHFLEAVGRRSLNIFCVHTVEIIAIPWYLMVAKFSAQPVLGMWLQYAISLGSIWLVCELLRVRRALIIRFFPAQRRTPAVHYTSRH